MKIRELNKINRLYFGYEDVARALNIGMDSARVAVSRYVQAGILLRLKRNIYILRERWNYLDRAEQFILANIGQVPSYISLMTALDHYGISTQMQRDIIESVSVKRTREIVVENTAFRYTKIRSDLYFAYEKKAGYFIATPEKAFLDAVYLVSLGRYAMDRDAIDIGRLDAGKIAEMCRNYPPKMKKMMENHGYFTTT